MSGNKKRKFIDENGRLFGLISVIDILVIIVVAVMAIAVYTKMNSNDVSGVTVKTFPVTYQVSIKTVRKQAAEVFRVGDAAYAEGGYAIGTITGVEILDGTTISTLNDGSQVEATVEGRYDVVLTIEVDCSSSGGRLYANKNYELGENAEIKMYTKYNKATAIVLDVEYDK